MGKYFTVEVVNLCKTIDVLKANQRTYDTTTLQSDLDMVFE
jgi:hypothetical protein